MSIINKMLQELDKRQAPQFPAGFGAPGSDPLAHAMPPIRPGRARLVWRLLAGVVVVVLAGVAWVMWQTVPRSAVNEIAHQSLGRARSPHPAPLVVSEAPATLPAAPAAPPRAPAPAPSASPDSSRVDMLRLATEIVTPISAQRGKAIPAARPPDMENTGAVLRDARAAKAADRSTAPAGRSEAPPQDARAAGPAASESARIDKRVDATPRQRAESEFRRAMIQVNQGRMAEGMEGLKAALAADPAYETARQTLVSLLLEARRIDEATTVLQEGLDINANHIGFTMLLARIHVERGDPGRALADLQKIEAAAGNNADYQAFVAALDQRLGRHAQAIEHYQVALRLAPGAGAWWAGLGISQEAADRPKDAADSFRRAKATGSLSAELVAYVEQRLKQLQ